MRSLRGSEAAQVPGAGTDALKALQSLPGVTTGNDASSEPAVRGSRPGDNAYYVDFLPVGYLFHVGGLISVLPGELVRSFDLHSAAFGPQFTDVTGAVLDVSLRRPRSDRLGGQLDASLLASGLLVEGPLAEDWSVMLSARRSYLDLLARKPLTDDNSGVVVRLPRYNDHLFKLLWRVGEGQELSLHLNGAADHIDFRVPEGSTAGTQEPALVGEGRNDTAYATQALQWESSLPALGRHRIALGRTVTRIGSAVGSAADVGVRVTQHFLRNELHLRPHAEHQLWLGAAAESNRARLDVDLLNARCTEFDPECDISSGERTLLRESLSIEQFDLSARERWQFTPQWALSTGVRHSRDRYLGRTHTEPRLGLEYAWSGDTTLSAAWGRHNQQPSPTQILAGLGNPQLAHLRARHAVLGIRQGLAQGWSWQAELYEKTFSELVIADPVLNYRNGGSGRAYGAELLLRKEAGESDLSGWLSVSWARSQRRNDATGEQFRFEFDQPLVVNLVGRWQYSPGLSFGAKWSFHSGNLITPILGGRDDGSGRIRPVYGALNSERLGPYHRLDLRLDRQVSARLNVYGELINAYNRQNVSGYSYSADYSQREPETQLPLLISVGAVWSF
jgi:hypothetical protein